MLNQIAIKYSSHCKAEYGSFSIDNLMFVFIILSPFATNYVFYSAVSIGDFFVFVTIPWLFYCFSIRALNLLYVILALIVIAISYVVLGAEVYSGFYRAALYFLLFFILISLVGVNFNKFFRYYLGFCLFSSGALLLQWVGNVVFDYSILLQLPISYYEPDTLEVIDHVYRSGGLFREPSYFSLFVAPAFFYLLIRGEYLRYGVVAIAGVVSTSSLAFFLILASVIYVLSRSKYFFLYIILFAILSGLVFWGAKENLTNFIFVERIVLIFEDGGTLVDRFMPFVFIANVSDSFFANYSAYSYFMNEKYWFNSAGSLVAYLGFAGLVLIVVALSRLNWIFAFCFFALIMTTHFMSNAFSFFVAFSFFALDNIVKNEGNK